MFLFYGKKRFFNKYFPHDKLSLFNPCSILHDWHFILCIFSDRFEKQINAFFCHRMLPLFVQFALNLSNLSLVPWRLLLALYENQSNCTCNKIDYIFIIVLHITSFGHLRWLRSIDYEFAWIHAKSKSKSKWKWKSKANPIGRQFEGKLSFNFCFCLTVLHSPTSLD